MHEVQAIAKLASTMSALPTPQSSSPEAMETPAEPSTTALQGKPSASPSPLPSIKTSTPIATSLYDIRSRRKICDPDFAAPLIQVNVLDAAGDPLPGIEVRVTWDEGEDHFFTGLKPELGLGYADFAMSEGIVYTLQLVGLSEPVSDIQAETCQDDQGAFFLGSWMLIFRQ